MEDNYTHYGLGFFLKKPRLFKVFVKKRLFLIGLRNEKKQMPRLLQELRNTQTRGNFTKSKEA